MAWRPPGSPPGLLHSWSWSQRSRAGRGPRLWCGQAAACPRRAEDTAPSVSPGRTLIPHPLLLIFPAKKTPKTPLSSLPSSVFQVSRHVLLGITFPDIILSSFLPPQFLVPHPSQRRGHPPGAGGTEQRSLGWPLPKAGLCISGEALENRTGCGLGWILT